MCPILGIKRPTGKSASCRDCRHTPDRTRRTVARPHFPRLGSALPRPASMVACLSLERAGTGGRMIWSAAGTGSMTPRSARHPARRLTPAE